MLTDARIFIATDILSLQDTQITQGLPLLPQRMQTEVLRYCRRENQLRFPARDGAPSKHRARRSAPRSRLQASGLISTLPPDGRP